MTSLIKMPSWRFSKSSLTGWFNVWRQYMVLCGSMVKHGSLMWFPRSLFFCGGTNIKKKNTFFFSKSFFSKFCFQFVFSIFFCLTHLFFSDSYLGEFSLDWNKRYLFSEQNFARNLFKLITNWLKQNLFF